MDTIRTAALFLALTATAAFAGDITARPVKADLSKAEPSAAYWNGVPSETVSLMAQPMIAPRPKETKTSSVKVQALTDGKFVAFRVTWADKDKSEAGRLGEFSDGIAIQFPVNDKEFPPPVMMGAKDDPVHIFHWRAQYQRDAEKGKPTMKMLYPNMSIDAFPMVSGAEEVDSDVTPRVREQYNPGKAEGNPQSYAKSGVDEIFAEGFATSSVNQGSKSAGVGAWKNGEWSVVITRPLSVLKGSKLEAGKKGWAAFAVWQGGEDEVGSRKSVTMAWSPVVVGK